jgi:hypothetical protein
LSSFPNIVIHLHAKPRFGIAAERLFKSYCHIGRNASMAVYQVAEGLAGYVKNLGTFGYRKAQWIKAILPHYFAGMRRIHHSHLHNSSQVISQLLMIIDQIDVLRTALFKTENNSPVTRNAHCSKAFEIAPQWVQPVTR